MIRPALDEDAAEIAAFYADIRRDTVPVVHTVADIANWIQLNLISRRSSYVWEEDGEIKAWADCHDGWLDQLYCRRGCTGKGLGRLLLEEARRRNPLGLQLYTFQVNLGARAFYLREGFVEIALSDGADNEEKAPDVRMEWRPRSHSGYIMAE